MRVALFRWAGSRRAASTSLLVATAALAGCGGGSSSGAKHATSSVSVATETADHTTPLATSPMPVTEGVRNLTTKATGGHSGTVTAGPGDDISFDTSFGKNDRSSAAVVTVQTAAARSLVAAVRPARNAAAAHVTVRGKGGRMIRLTNLRYVCQFPPHTFCPLDGISRTRHGYRVQVAASSTTVSFVGTVTAG